MGGGETFRGSVLVRDAQMLGAVPLQGVCLPCVTLVRAHEGVATEARALSSSPGFLAGEVTCFPQEFPARRGPGCDAAHMAEPEQAACPCTLTTAN